VSWKFLFIWGIFCQFCSSLAKFVFFYFEAWKTFLRLRSNLKIHRKIDQSFSDLKAIVALWIDKLRLAHQSQCAELALVVNNVKKPLAGFADESMGSTDWNIGDPDIRVVASAENELLSFLHV